MRCVENATGGARKTSCSQQSFVAPPPRRSHASSLRRGRARSSGAPAGNGGTPRAPTGIVVPPLGAGPFVYHTAEGQDIRVVVHTRGLSRPWSLVVAAERRDARDGARRPAAHRSRRHARSAADRRRAARARAGLSGLFDVALHPQFATNRFVYLSYNKPVGERQNGLGRRARRLERPRADRRARHLRHDGLEQRLAARVRPRRQALRQHVRQCRRRHRCAESHEPRRQGAAA